MLSSAMSPAKPKVGYDGLQRKKWGQELNLWSLSFNLTHIQSKLMDYIG